jgi:hypothetical protein
MQKWLVDGLLVGSAALIVGSVTSVATANATNGALAGGAVSGVGTALAGRRRSQQQEQKMQVELQAQLQQAMQQAVTIALNQQAEALDQSLRRLRHQVSSSLTAQQEESQSRLRQQVMSWLERARREQQWNQSQFTSIDRSVKQLESQLSMLTMAQVEKRSVPDFAKLLPASDEILEPLVPSPLLLEKQVVIDWLNEQKIWVEDYYKPDANSINLDRVAVYLGRNYSNLKSLHQRLRRSNKSGKRFHFPLHQPDQPANAETVQVNLEFCELLRQAKFLDYHYNDTEEAKAVSLVVNEREDLERYLNGGWFERFIFYQVSDFLTSLELPHSCLENAKVIFPDGDRHELDLMFWVDGIPLWIECKAGRSFHEYFTLYSRLRIDFGIPKENALVVVLKLSAQQARTRTLLHHVTVINPSMLEPMIEIALNLRPHQTTQQFLAACVNAKEVERSSAAPFPSTPLSRANLKPVPQHRTAILTALVEQFKQPIVPTNSFVLKSQLLASLTQATDEFSQPISATAISHVLTSLRVSGCFLDQDQQPVQRLGAAFASLCSLDVAQLEAKCIESYICKVLQFDLDYFDHPENIDRFEQKVNGQVPDSDRIAQLKTEVQAQLQRQAAESAPALTELEAAEIEDAELLTDDDALPAASE